MSSAFSLDLRPDGIGVLTFDLAGEKVNKFSRAVMEELSEVVGGLASRRDVKALVLRSAKDGVFVAGADLDEFLGIRTPEQAAEAARFGQRVFDALEALPFPVVAAINGAAVGGGCELALACDIRLLADTEKARIGLPETMLGIFPGWGGTHRLARQVGPAAALDVILAGKTLVPRKAKSIGLVDEVVPAAILDERALARAAEAAKEGKRPRGTRRGKGLASALLESNPAGRAILFAMARKAMLRQTRGNYPAPEAALESVKDGIARGIAAAQESDTKRLAALAVGPVARALLDIYFWSERAKKENGLPEGRLAEPLAVRGIGVLGAGVMGGGIAQLAADRAESISPGEPLVVRMKDVAPEALARGMAAAEKLWKDAVRKKRLPRRELPYRMARITTSLDWSGFAPLDVTVEAVVEKLEIKQAVLAEWEKVARPDAIFASNTSTLPIGSIAAKAARPERVVGMHFFNPVSKMPLVEVIRGERTDDRAVATIVALSKAMGKTPVVVADRPGFLVNRVLGTYLNEAVLMVEEGIDAGSVDRAGRNYGLPMGPLTLLDEVGLDVAAKAAHVLLEAFGSRMTAAKGIDALASAGRHGKKAGKGFFRYDAAGKRTGLDPEAVAQVRAAGGRSAMATPAGVSLADRLVLPMVKEAILCLDEGVVASAEKLDLALIFGIGFPPFRGGILKAVDARGAADTLRVMEALAAVHGERFAPPPGLVERARTGATFHPAR